MEFIIGGRQIGKTHQLIEWARGHDDRKIIVATEVEVSHLRKRYAFDHDPHPDRLRTWQFVTAEMSLLSRQHDSQSVIHYAIDNLDLMLPSLLRLRGPVDIVTARGVVRRNER